MIKMPVSFKEFAKDPIKAIMFIMLLAIGYLYVDNKGVMMNQIQDQQARIIKLEKKVDDLTNKLLYTAKTISNE